jgi:amphi-Trp domain-containing protein
MGDERTLYESESHRTMAEVIDFLQQLAGWLGERRLGFDRDGKTIWIAVPEEVELEIELEEEDEGDRWVKRSLEIELTWLEERVGSSAEEEE